jgi:hypothetical protein
MTNLVFGFDNWQKIYSDLPREEKYNIWIYALLSNDQQVYVPDYKLWFDLKKYCAEKDLKINTIGLRYRSHQIEQKSDCAEGVYVVRSIKGEFGGVSKQCYTIGLLQDNVVNKTMWVTPELIEECTSIEQIEDCFEEAIIYQHDRQKK